MKMQGKVPHFRPSKLGQPKPLENDDHPDSIIDHPDLDMKSVTS